MSKQGQQISEQELIKQCMSDNVPAQNELYRRFARQVMGIAMRYSKNREDAQDIVQDTFVKIFVSLKNFKGEGSFEGWIKRITVNTSINHNQKYLKFTNETDIDAVYDLSYDDKIIEKLGANELIGMVQGLPTGFRTIFNLYAIEGYTHEEIGQKLGIAEGTSKSQLARARQQLVKQINKNKLYDHDK